MCINLKKRFILCTVTGTLLISELFHAIVTHFLFYSAQIEKIIARGHGKVKNKEYLFPI